MSTLTLVFRSACTVWIINVVACAHIMIIYYCKWSEIEFNLIKIKIKINKNECGEKVKKK